VALDPHARLDCIDLDAPAAPRAVLGVTANAFRAAASPRHRAESGPKRHSAQFRAFSTGFCIVLSTPEIASAVSFSALSMCGGARRPSHLPGGILRNARGSPASG
jgi:hypothetical protein